MRTKFSIYVCCVMTLLLSYQLNAYAQERNLNFEWQPDGTMKTALGESYQIVSFEGQTKEQIYNELLLAASSIYNNPQETISSVENKLISISGIQDVYWNVGGLLGGVTVNFHYVLKFHIKDNRVKVDAPYFTLLTFSTGGTQDDIEGWTKAQKFFDKNGTPNPKKKRNAEFCYSVNDQFNNILNTILNYNGTDEDW